MLHVICLGTDRLIYFMAVDIDKSRETRKLGLVFWLCAKSRKMYVSKHQGGDRFTLKPMTPLKRVIMVINHREPD